MRRLPQLVLLAPVLATVAMVGTLFLGRARPALASASASKSLPPAFRPDRVSFQGELQDRLEAGDYRYFQVLDPKGEPVWVATLTLEGAAPQGAGAAVQVRAFGRLDRFHSRRLARDFSPLLFGSVRAAAPSSTRRPASGGSP